jgi:hypothetical protein
MQVFISHSWKDSSLAKKLATVLEKSGFRVWDVSQNLLPGDNWAKSVAQALDESQAMVVLLTPESIHSPWVKNEIEHALGNSTYAKRLIPVLVGAAESEIPWILRKLDSIVALPDANANNDQLQKIAQMLKEAA